MRKLSLIILTLSLTGFSFHIGESAYGLGFLLLGLVSFIDFFL